MSHIWWWWHAQRRFWKADGYQYTDGIWSCDPKFLRWCFFRLSWIPPLYRLLITSALSCIMNRSSLQSVLHDWCNKGHGICYPVCGMVHIKEPLLLIRKSSPCSVGSGFPLSLSEWSFTINYVHHHITIKLKMCWVYH